MGLGGVCHRMVMGYAEGSPGGGLRVIFDPKGLVQLERREASVVSSIPARSPIPKAKAAAL